ncbi:hypothetical protein NBRC111894_4015 [Sporolactobacillus inulinus]|uniref:Uncharacterized protein n=1 Tax=Sporolactobacillus inulinus TaxID=2078 RepID=A0A4Y1ZHM0_9BACL|nr:hypothetical protein NBRC111894_4015 [Sporolactobacillus inulinus]
MVWFGEAAQLFVGHRCVKGALLWKAGLTGLKNSFMDRSIS